MVLPSGQRIERVPAWISRVEQDQKVSPLFEGEITHLSLFHILTFPPFCQLSFFCLTGIFWNPPEKYVWKHKRPVLGANTGLKIYESHGKPFFLDPFPLFLQEYSSYILRANFDRCLFSFSIKLKKQLESRLLKARSPPTTNSLTTSSPGSSILATTASSSWPSWSTRTTPALDTKSPTSSPSPVAMVCF